MRTLILLIFSAVSLAHAKSTLTCGPGQYKVNGHNRKAYIKADGTQVSATVVKTYCKDYSESYALWSKNLINSPVPEWPHKTESFNHWSEEDKERLYESIDYLPKKLLSDTIHIYRAKRSKDYPNPATSADGIIVLYDEAFSGKANLARILGHEFAHQKYRDLSTDDRIDYQYSTNWLIFRKRDGSEGYFSRKDGYVADDGKISPEEDFANNIEFYLFERNSLKKKTPNADRWIEKKFGTDFKFRGQK